MDSFQIWLPTGLICIEHADHLHSTLRVGAWVLRDSAPRDETFTIWARCMDGGGHIQFLNFL